MNLEIAEMVRRWAKHEKEIRMLRERIEILEGRIDYLEDKFTKGEE